MKLSVFCIQYVDIFLFCCLIKEASCQELYVGCYTTFSGPFAFSALSVSQCLTKCKSQISLFAALKNGSSCYCGNTTNTRVPSSNCNLTCDDNNGTCGGNNFFAVYTGVPTYLGCFNDVSSASDKDMIATHNVYQNQVTDECYEFCSKGDYKFMATQNGNECFCGQKFGKYGRASESECSLPCSGDGDEICGGQLKNSFYSVGYLPGLNKSYSQVFHCLNGGTDMHGTCTSNTCQPGWKGTKCNQRDCTINNGNCGQQQCQEIQIGNQMISECLCKEGYQFHSISDEFTSSQCSVNFYKCTNLTSCIKLLNDKCGDTEVLTQSLIDGANKKIEILATFLALFMCFSIIVTSGMVFYRTKTRNLTADFKKLQKKTQNIHSTNLAYTQLSAEEHADSHIYKKLEVKMN